MRARTTCIVVIKHWGKNKIARVSPSLLPSVGVVLDGLGVDLTAAHVLDGQRQPLPVLDLRVPHGLQVGLLHLAVLGPDDLAAGVHGHGRLLSTQLAWRWRGEKRR